MRDTRKEVGSYLQPIFLELIHKQIKDAIYIHYGYELDLNENDAKTIDEILNLAVDTHELIGSIGALKQPDSTYFSIPITESCYNTIDKIINDCNRDRKISGCLLRNIDIIFDEKKYTMVIHCLFRTVDDQYYLFESGYE